MDQKLLVEIRANGQTFTNNPSEKFLLMILCSQAKLENDNKSINVKRGLKTRVEMGLWPAPAPCGYVKEKRMDRKCETLIDPERASVIKKMFEKLPTRSGQVESSITGSGLNSISTLYRARNHLVLVISIDYLKTTSTLGFSNIREKVATGIKANTNPLSLKNYLTTCKSNSRVMN